jgi:adenylate cyclase
VTSAPKGRLTPVQEPGNRATKPVMLGSARVTFGRAPSNQVVLGDPEVSKFHAEIVLESNAFVLRDLGSSNGTHVNGRAVKSHRLAPGDRVVIGSCRYDYKPGEAREETSVAIVPQSPVEHTKVLASAAIEALLPSAQIREQAVLQSSYERVRAAFVAVQRLIETTDIRTLCERILEVSFDLVKAESGAVLLFDEGHDLTPWATKSVKDEAQQIVISRSIVDHVIAERAAVLATDALTDSRWSTSESVVLSGMRSLMCVPLLSVDNIYGILHVGNATQTGAFLKTDVELLSGLGTGAGVALSNAFLAYRLAEEAKTRESLGRFLSPQVVDQVLKQNVDINRGGDEAEVTVMFADIRGFTSLTERSKASDVVGLLNEYFDQMVEVVFKHHGILDKFIGDAIMAVWGTPVSRHDDASSAVAAAREMQITLSSLNAFRVDQGKEPIEVGIGLASGECVAGAVGARRRMEFTVIGDAVNLASRLCDRAKAGEVICDEETLRRAHAQSDSEPLPAVQVKGKEKPVPVFRLHKKA